MSTAFPTSIKLTKFELGLNENKAMSQSLITRYRQATSLGAGTSDMWEGVIETAPLDDAYAKTFLAWLETVGLWGSFDIRDPRYTGALSGQTSILVNGGSQSGTSLICDGATPSVVCVRAGEYFQVGTEYKMAISDATADGAGNVTLSFRPALRTSPANNAAVTLNTPRLYGILTSKPPKAPDGNLLHTFTFSYEEALP
jgi:hypothetical protein